MTLRLVHPSPGPYCEAEASPAHRRPLRVLYLQPSPLFGGAERQLTFITPLLPRHGIEVLPVIGPGQVIADWFSAQGVARVVRSPNFPSFSELHGLSQLTLPLRYLKCGAWAVQEMARLVRAEQPDLILASLPFAWLTGGLVAKVSRLPIIWRAGGIGPSQLERRALAMVAPFIPPNLLLCNAEAVRSVFSPLVPAPTAVIPNGVDQRVFHPAAGDPRRFRPRGVRLVVGSAMRLAESKRPHDFLRLALRLRSQHPEVRLLLAGDGAERGHLERAARRSGADNLSFLGFVEDMPSFYRACDLLVLTSRSEGSPNFVLEGMAMRKPLVLASIPPLLEMVSAENAAWFPLGNIDELSRAVSRLLLSADVRDELGERALQRAAAYSLDDCAARLATTLHAVANGQPATSPIRAMVHPQRPAAERAAKTAAE